MILIRRRPTLRVIACCIALFTLISAPIIYSRNGRRQTPRLSTPAQNQRTTRITSTQSAAVDRQNQLSEGARQQIAALLAEKATRTPTEQKIDSQLLQAVRESHGQQMVAGLNLPRADVKADDTGKLTVDISAMVSDDLLTRI